MIPTVRKKLVIVRMTNKVFITIQKFERIKLVINWEMTMIKDRADNDLIIHSIPEGISALKAAYVVLNLHPSLLFFNDLNFHEPGFKFLCT